MSTKSKVLDCGLDGLTFTEPSLCKPQFADDCDLSNIIRRFLKTGELPQMQSKPTISDATGSPSDLFEAIEPAVKLRQAFDQLSLEERNRFNNDPEAWFAEQSTPEDPPKEVPADPVKPEDPLKEVPA